jgi:hypothetical protein
MTIDTLLDAALSYAARGWRVHPLHTPTITDTGARCSCARGFGCPDKQKGKHPRLSEWPEHATTDAVRIQAWWKKWPTANIGIVTGPQSGLAVLDIDPRNGGDVTLAQLLAHHGALPETPIVLSGGGGQHYDFLLTDDLPSLKLDGIDFLTAGHYVLAPPSLHPSGQRYTWELSSEPDDVPLAPIPAWLRTLVETTVQAYTAAASTLPEALPTVDLATLRISSTIKTVITLGNKRKDPYPSRSEALFAVETSLIRAGYDDATIAAILLDPQYGISDKPLHQKDPRAAQYWTLTKGWLARDLARARAKVEAAAAQAAAPRNAPRMWQHPRNGEDPTPSVVDLPLQVSKEGTPLETIGNLLKIFRRHHAWHGRLWEDSVRMRPMLDTEPLTDHDALTVAEWLGDTYDMRCRHPRLLLACLESVCAEHPRDRLREWLEALPPWDGIPRLHDWLQVVAGMQPGPYCSAVSRLFLLALVARALDPGSICRTVVILQGLEDTGKSRLLHDLVGEDWYIETSGALEGKEPHLLIQGVWLCELSELDSLTRTEENRLKSFLTMRRDSYLPKYSNTRVDIPRRTVFVGTTNDDTYLKGQTGNTRFFPVQTGRIDLPVLHDMRAQLFAEAVHVYQTDPAHWWHLAPEVLALVTAEREERRVTSVYENALSSWLQGKDKTTWEDIARYFLLMETPERWKDRTLQMEIAKALKALGWTRGKQERVGGVRQRPWLAPEAEA